MSPRPYRLGLREEAVAQTRARILAAARELLASPGGIAAFTVDAVARQAGVARMTIYYQFRSKDGLLEALFDDLAARGGMDQLAAAFKRQDPLEALDAFVATLARFWASDRLLHRRLHALAALDPEFGPVWQARQERRRHGLQVLLGRLAEQRGWTAPGRFQDMVDLLFTLTSFPTFDMLAGEARATEQVVLLLQRLARAALQPDPDGLASES